MSKYTSGPFTPKNPTKYVGKGTPHFRSSWELAVFRFCDLNPAVISWASEFVSVPYRNPLTKKISHYVPDLFMMYVDKNGKKHVEVIEIKPLAETVIEMAKGARGRATVAVNHAKWQACEIYCQKKGFKFRVITERDIFAGIKK